jgi:hypothetical protein
VIHSAVYGGRGTVRFKGVTFPARIRFTHQAGQGYRHYMETTFWGQPLMRVNEHFLDGKTRLELPFGVVENEPKIDSAANLGLWAESLVLPSLYVTDPRVRWEPIDEVSARLIVPRGAGEGEDSFIVTFDPATGLIRSMETIRWRDAADEAKLGWRAEVRGWQEMHGIKIPASIAAVWQDEGTPWLVSQIEEAAYNVDVSEYIRATGP